MLTTRLIDPLINALDCSPWGSTTGRSAGRIEAPCPLYTPEQRLRRDRSPWTRVQGVLAIVQFAVFLISLALVLRFFATGEGFALATASVCVKTVVLYVIMVTGAIWEKEVFGRYLFAHAFFWEDLFSFLVIGLHTAYVGAVMLGLGDARMQMLIALTAYGAYAINAAQFLLKLRAARRDELRRYAPPSGITS